MKTAELSGAALDWAVAKCEGLLCFGYRTDGERFAIEDSDGQIEGFMPSADWIQGGAIIEREGMQLWKGGEWCAALDQSFNPTDFQTGTTPLVAAMRCYVASKLGDKVEIPDELFNHA